MRGNDFFFLDSLFTFSLLDGLRTLLVRDSTC
ncbi:hypothetical protein RSAG8_02373, partial [Rhizoctonia solani AG-8 WAC10335]